jgi:hypothetical protein
VFYFGRCKAIKKNSWYSEWQDNQTFLQNINFGKPTKHKSLTILFSLNFQRTKSSVFHFSPTPVISVGIFDFFAFQRVDIFKGI